MNKKIVVPATEALCDAYRSVIAQYDPPFPCTVGLTCIIPGKLTSQKMGISALIGHTLEGPVPTTSYNQKILYEASSTYEEMSIVANLLPILNRGNKDIYDLIREIDLAVGSKIRPVWEAEYAIQLALAEGSEWESSIR